MSFSSGPYGFDLKNSASKLEKECEFIVFLKQLEERDILVQSNVAILTSDAVTSALGVNGDAAEKAHWLKPIFLRAEAEVVRIAWSKTTLDAGDLVFEDPAWQNGNELTIDFHDLD